MIRCANATELYLAMEADLHSLRHRTASDGAQTKLTVEAPPGSQYALSNIAFNVAGGVELDRKWAAAYTLHFFANTENADGLRRHKDGADRFLTKVLVCREQGRWIAPSAPNDEATDLCGRCHHIAAYHDELWEWEGAYGAAVVPQLRLCLAKLYKDKHTRRAIVTMPNLEHENFHRPSCWTSLHFLLNWNNNLDMLVYQRSLNLAIMPTDLVCLTNILHYTASMIGVPAGSLLWTVGSLHAVEGVKHLDGVQRPRNESMLFPIELLDDEQECRQRLLNM